MGEDNEEFPYVTFKMVDTRGGGPLGYNGGHALDINRDITINVTGISDNLKIIAGCGGAMIYNGRDQTRLITGGPGGQGLPGGYGACTGYVQKRSSDGLIGDLF